MFDLFCCWVSYAFLSHLSLCWCSSDYIIRTIFTLSRLCNPETSFFTPNVDFLRGDRHFSELCNLNPSITLHICINIHQGSSSSKSMNLSVLHNPKGVRILKSGQRVFLEEKNRACEEMNKVEKVIVFFQSFLTFHFKSGFVSSNGPNTIFPYLKIIKSNF